MPGQTRLGDKSQVPADAHGCPACPHPCIGPAIVGSPDVNVNGRPALRVGDTGIHMACCGPNTWTAQTGSSTVLINGQPAHRVGDHDLHCGGMGQMISGSPDVMVGDGGGAGGDVAAAPTAPAGAPTHDVQVTVLSHAGEPLAKVRYELTLPDGTVRRGFSDAAGLIKETGIEAAGECLLVLPDVDRAASKDP